MAENEVQQTLTAPVDCGDGTIAMLLLMLACMTVAHAPLSTATSISTHSSDDVMLLIQLSFFCVERLMSFCVLWEGPNMGNVTGFGLPGWL